MMMNTRLIHGDCLEELKRMGDGSVDVIVTSPPYNLKMPYSNYEDNKDYEDYLKWMREIFIELERVLSEDGSFFLNVGFSSKNPWLHMDVASLAKGLFQLQNNITWVKSVTTNGKSYGHFKPINSKRYINRTFEAIFHFTKTGDVTLDRLAIGVPYKHKSNILRWNGTVDKRCRGNTWFIPYHTIMKKSQRGNHPAVFPVELPEMCIKLHGTDKEPIVLDPFVGVGTTLVAAEKLGLSSIGIDIDAGYLAIARSRLREVRSNGD